MARIYLSPSTQDFNEYWDGSTNEETEMRAICLLTAPLLVKAGHVVMVGGSLSAAANAAESNAWKADYHFACHTDTGGGDGTTGLYFPGSPASYAFCLAIYNRVAAVSLGSDNGLRGRSDLVELNAGTNAISALVELAFHDRTDEGTQIKTQHEAFARAIAQGICDYCGGTLEPVEAPKPAEPKKLVGAHLHVPTFDSNAQVLEIVQEGDFVRIVSAIRGLCLEVMDGISDRRAPVRFAERVDGEGKERQLWRLEYRETGQCTIVVIVSALNEEYVLDVVNGSTSAGAGLQTCERNDTAAQDFLVVPVPNTTYVNILSRKALLPVDMDNAGE